MDKYIFRERKSLSNETCENLITLFEDSPSKVRNIRNYTMLNLKLSDFSDIYTSLIDRLKKYHNNSLKIKREARKEVFKAQCDRRSLEDRYDDLR